MCASDGGSISSSTNEKQSKKQTSQLEMGSESGQIAFSKINRNG